MGEFAETALTVYVPVIAYATATCVSMFSDSVQ